MSAVEYGSAAWANRTSFAKEGVKRIAHNAQKSIQRVHQWRGANAESMPIGVALQRTRDGDLTYVQWLCAEANGHYTPGTPSDEPLPSLTARLAREVADYVATVLMDASPDAQLKEADEFIAVAVQARAAIVAAAHAAKRTANQSESGGSGQ